MGFLDRVRFAFRDNPTVIDDSMSEQGMGSTSAFGPGTPQQPANPPGTQPRSRDFASGYNISRRPRTGERVSFQTLKALSESYDVAQLAISHTIDDVRSMTYNVKVAPWYRGEADDALDRARKVLRRPDGDLPFISWLAAYLDDVLRYDAGTLLRLRNRRGDVTGLQVVDGTTIAPLLDELGNKPQPPAPAYVQYAQGVPWVDLTRHDLVSVPFRPRPGSPYGLAPLEMVLLNANTDLRFQTFFLRRFTEGTIPEGFAEAPSDWTPGQIQEFQAIWDDMLYGDEAAKHQIKWVPNGTNFTWAKDHPFETEQAKYLERKTLVAFGRVPSDMGITDDVNRSTGDSQADVQFRIGTLPLVRFVESILDAFLQDDLGLPVVGEFDTGQETEDRLATAQADEIYIQNAVVSSDEIREKRFGLPVDDKRPFGRFVYGQRTGPIPVAAIDAVAGPIDPETYSPADGAELPRQVFAPIEGVAPAKPPAQPPLAVERFGAAAAPQGDVAAVTKAETEGVTSDTGIVGVDLVDDEPDDLIAKAGELAAFRRFAKTRRHSGAWRDFTFAHHDAVTAHRLNDAGRTQVRKAAGELVAAGLCVRAADTGRVLVIQRALDENDPASGAVEFPGGHIETGETPDLAAAREWTEETGLALPVLPVDGSWTSPNGIYAGYVVTVASEDSLDLTDRDTTADPDGDTFEALFWLDPDQLADNPMIRDELAADAAQVQAAIAPVAKASDARPKAGDPRWHSAPVRQVEAKALDHHAAAIRSALASLLSRDALASLTRAFLNRD